MKKIESLNLFRKNKTKTFSDLNNESDSCDNENSNIITLLNTNSHKKINTLERTLFNTYCDTLKINEGINLENIQVYAVNFEDDSFKDQNFPALRFSNVDNKIKLKKRKVEPDIKSSYKVSKNKENPDHQYEYCEVKEEMEDDDYLFVDNLSQQEVKNIKNFMPIDLNKPSILRVPEKPVTVDAKTQVYKDELMPEGHFINSLKTNRSLYIATGIDSFEILNKIMELAKPEYKIPKTRSNNKVVDLRSKIIITYLKLKQNLPYVFMSLLFNDISSGRCGKIFVETLKLLSSVLKNYTTWNYNNNNDNKDKKIVTIPKSYLMDQRLKTFKIISEVENSFSEIASEIFTVIFATVALNSTTLKSKIE